MVVDREPAFLTSLSLPNLDAHYPGLNSLEKIQNHPLDQKPYWHIERTRIGSSRAVSVHSAKEEQRLSEELAFDVPGGVGLLGPYLSSLSATAPVRCHPRWEPDALVAPVRI
jgi:hypothetical protein